MSEKTRKIYLASSSKQRRKILREAGICFRVFPVSVPEKDKHKHLSYAGIVRLNALNKAKEAAKRIKSGLIIAADTIMVDSGKIFGKPKNMQDAKKMLKASSGKAQFVYTGIAVVDRDSGRIYSDYEKTKVLMDKITNEDINSYFKKVNPLDKAGSFDIQGRGALFIRRIDGCFYNVVGLPLRKLLVILKKAKAFCFLIFISQAFLAMSISGCSTEYNMVTGEQEMFYYSTDKEVDMGKAIVKQVEKEYKLVDDPLVQKRVQDIGNRIVAVCDRKEIDYTFYVLDDDEVNAVSLPGGFIFINKGLVDKVSSDDELAAVIAHEIGHIVARHSIKKLQGLQGYSILRILLAATPQPGETGAAADAAFTELLLGYSREDELLADQLGARYTKMAGYDPYAMISFLKKLQEIDKRRPLRERSYYKTHPYVPDRIRIVKEELGEKINFKDYINVEQEPHK